eukprot:gene36497-59493_t
MAPSLPAPVHVASSFLRPLRHRDADESGVRLLLAIAAGVAVAVTCTWLAAHRVASQSLLQVTVRWGRGAGAGDIAPLVHGAAAGEMHSLECATRDGALTLREVFPARLELLPGGGSVPDVLASLDSLLKIAVKGQVPPLARGVDQSPLTAIPAVAGLCANGTVATFGAAFVRNLTTATDMRTKWFGTAPTDLWRLWAGDLPLFGVAGKTHERLRVYCALEVARVAHDVSQRAGLRSVDSRAAVALGPAHLRRVFREALVE